MVLQVDWRIVLPVFSLGLILTIYGLLIPLPPLFVLPKDPETWNQPFTQYPPVGPYYDMRNWTPRFPKQVVHDGDLILNGSETLVIENSTYMVNGSIRVSDNASLKLRNAELWIKKTTTSPSNSSIPMADLLLTDSSRLEMFNSSIVVKYYPEIVLIDQSRAVIKDSNFASDRAIFIVWDEAHVNIKRSTVYGIDLSLKASCTVNDSKIDHFSLGWSSARVYPLNPLDIPWQNVQARVYNSTIVILELRAVESSINVIGNIGGWHQIWSPSNFIQGGSYSNITLSESDIKSIMLLAENSTVNVRNNSDIWVLSLRGSTLTFINNSISELYFDYSKVDVSDSVIKIFNPSGESVGNVSRTLIDGLSLSDFNGSLRLEQVKTTSLWLQGNVGEILGDIQVVNKTSTIDNLGVWSLLKRGYTVLAEVDGRAAEGVELTLRNDQNETWEGKTNTTGRANFNVTYYRLWKLPNYIWADNATSTLTLTARLGDAEQVQNVTITSESPIMFSFTNARKSSIWTNKTTLIFSGTVIMIGALGFAVIKRRRGF